MAKKKLKAWLVTCLPPRGAKPKLALRAGDTGSKRTAVRNYFVQAENRAAAQSLAEAEERRLADQTETPVWKVDSVQAQ